MSDAADNEDKTVKMSPVEAGQELEETVLLGTRPELEEPDEGFDPFAPSAEPTMLIDGSAACAESEGDAAVGPSPDATVALGSAAAVFDDASEVFGAAVAGSADDTAYIPPTSRASQPAAAHAAHEADPFAPRDFLGATGPMPAVEQAGADEQPPRERHTLRNIALGMLLVVVVVLGGFAGWLAWDDSKNASCHVPAGVTLDGEDIAGYSAAEVRSVVNKHILAGTAGSAVLVLSEDKQVSLDYPRLGDVDVDATVSAAMATIEPNKVRRCAERALGLAGVEPAVEPLELVTVCTLSEERVHSKVAAIARDFDVDVRDAGYRFNQEKRAVKAVKARTGYAIDVDATTSAVLEASQAGQTEVQAVITTTQPTVTKVGQAIFVDLQQCHLYFYVAGTVAKDYPCTPGMAGYETPSGDWTVSYKDPSPSWYNPHSDWSKGMPEVIAPGANNPLGLRALALSCGGGIYIHGTTNLAQLGSPGSHGCIRLANESVVELYDLVEINIPVFVY